MVYDINSYLEQQGLISESVLYISMLIAINFKLLDVKICKLCNLNLAILLEEMTFIY